MVETSRGVPHLHRIRAFTALCWCMEKKRKMKNMKNEKMNIGNVEKRKNEK